MRHFLQWTLLFVLFSHSPIRGQEVKFLDLTQIQQRTELRVPKPPPSECEATKTCGVSAGFGGGSVSDGAPDRRDPHALGISLDRVAPHDITLDPFQVEFRVVNTGLAPIDIPVSPHLSDLQPADESKAFEFRSLSLVVYLDGTGPAQALGLGYVTVYGSPDHEGTILTLRPGEWVRVLANVKLHTWPAAATPAKLRGGFWLRQNNASPGFNRIVNLYPNSSDFPAVPINFTPTHSTVDPNPLATNH